MTRPGPRPLPSGVVLLAVVLDACWAGSLLASHTPPPTSVTIAGDLQSELGCPGDWQPDCALTHLGWDATDDVWQGTFAVPAGSWEYRGPVNDSWSESYGRYAEQSGPNMPLALGAPAAVKFYYDHKTHWLTSNRNAVIATAVGSFQSELACPGDWQPDCLRSWLQDPDEDGVSTFATNALPAGSYEAKVVIDESWDENYGAGGVQNGANLPFSVGPGATATFSYDAATHVLTVDGTTTTTTTTTSSTETTTTTTTSTTTTTTAPPPTIPGTGNPASECYVTVEGLRSAGGDRVDCTDGDPACDADGVADGQCTFTFRVCVAQALPGCSTTAIRQVTVLPASLRIPLPPVPAATPTCADEARLVVPLARGGRRIGRRTLTLVAKNRGRPKRDEDRIRLRCLPGER